MRSLWLALAAVGIAAAAHGAVFPRQRAEAEYRLALAEWAAGEDAAALARLARLAGDGSDRRAMDRLTRAKRGVARAAGSRQRDALLAIARLETQAYHEAVAQRRLQAAPWSRLLAAELATLHAEDGESRARTEAAAVIADLAAHLHQAAQEGTAGDLYQRALAIDALQPMARLGLAALREKRGDYAAAVTLLGGTPTVPGGREGQLRLALNLQRVGRRAEAEEALRALAAAGADWVRSVAAQELARTLAARGDVAAAARLLAAAATALPCDPSLPVQASLLAERAGGERPLDLARLADCAETAISPRARYTRAPAGELQALRESLRELDAGWRAALRQALAGARR